jgi:hypothetical protein
MQRKITINKINSYTTIQDYFLAHWVSIIGYGPAMLYLQLLSYCHKGKDTAWPSIQTLNKRMGTTTKTLIKYRNALVNYGLIKKVVKQKSSSGGYDHNLYQIILLDQEKVLLPPVERCPEETEEVISGIAGEYPSHNQDNPKKINTDNIKSLKKNRIIEELKRLKLDKESISKIILNYSPEGIEEKLDLLEIKKKVINPAGWLVAALQGNYPTSEYYKKEEEEETTKTEEMELERRTMKTERALLPMRVKEGTGRLSREESLGWIRHIRNDVLCGK